jgi:hypothetical protein|tara:strand:+ start:10801 stop:10995 length:195 start_codon:yes stop_codon:yes gene_type:complete
MAFEAKLFEMGKELTRLRSRIADLESIIDEIPNLGALFAAVQELQEKYDAPASEFIHYVGGARR